MCPKERLSHQEQLATLANVLARRFIRRDDLYAKQLENGSYICVHNSLTDDHLIAHLAGKVTLGAYLLDENSEGQYMVLDADDEPDWRRLKALAICLAEEGTASYLERSRRGGHLWFFFHTLLSGTEIRQFGHGLLHRFGIKSVELYPKQDELTSGPGSLIRLPFGIHRKSGRRYGFYFPNGESLGPTLRAQIRALEGTETVQNDIFNRFCAYAATTVTKSHSSTNERPPLPAQTGQSEGAPISDRIKAAVTVREFVLQYVKLSAKGKGLCPFHDDQVASFSINDTENYWHCFACGTGGSIIDFWMQWRKCNFAGALRELATILNL